MSLNFWSEFSHFYDTQIILSHDKAATQSTHVVLAEFIRLYKRIVADYSSLSNVPRFLHYCPPPTPSSAAFIRWWTTHSNLVAHRWLSPLYQTTLHAEEIHWKFWRNSLLTFSSRRSVVIRCVTAPVVLLWRLVLSALLILATGRMLPTRVTKLDRSVCRCRRVYIPSRMAAQNSLLVFVSITVRRLSFCVFSLPFMTVFVRAYLSSAIAVLPSVFDVSFPTVVTDACAVLSVEWIRCSRRFARYGIGKNTDWSSDDGATSRFSTTEGGIVIQCRHSVI